MSLRLALTAASLCCALASPAAHATARAGVSLFGFQFVLTDLDPTDGVTPFFKNVGGFEPGAAVTSQVTDSRDAANDDYEQAYGRVMGEAWFVPLSASASNGLARASGAMSDAGHFASAFATGESSARTDTTLRSSHLLNFHTSAQTAVTLRGWVHAEVAAAGLGDSALADISLVMIKQESPQQSFDQVLRADAAHGGHQELLMPFELSFVNTSEEDAFGFLGGRLDAEAISVSAVPEPATGPLMFGGLLLLVGLRHRRKGL